MALEEPPKSTTSLKEKILLVLGYQLPFPGAGWRRIEYFAKYLKAQGLEVTVVGATKLTEMFTIYKHKKRWLNKDIYVLNILPFSVSPLYLLLTTLFAPLYLLILRPNVLIVSSPPPEPFIGFIIWKKIFKYKIILDVRDDVFGEFVLKKSGVEKIYYKVLSMFIDKFIRHVDFVTIVTQGLAEKFRERYHLKGRIIIIPNGANLEEFDKALASIDERFCNSILGRSGDELVIVFSGAAVETHNPVLLLPALMLLKIKNQKLAEKVKLIIIGPRTKLLDYTMSLAEKYNLKNNLKYLGVYNDLKDVARILSCADIGLIPRVEDPFFDHAIPAKFYEYIGAGLPVLALCRRESDLAKMVKKYKLGTVCETKDLICQVNFIKEIIMYKDKEISELKKSINVFRKNIDREKSGKILHIIIKNLFK